MDFDWQAIAIVVLAVEAVAERVVTWRGKKKLEARDDAKMADYARMYQNSRRELQEHIKSRLHGR